MKKILTALGLCFCFAFAGVFLCACETKGDKTITIDLSETNDCVYATVNANGEDVEGEDGKFVVPYESKLKVSFYAKQYGIDISNENIQFTVNGTKRNLVTKNASYKPWGTNSTLQQNEQEFLFGSFSTIVDSNLTLKLGELQKCTSTFTFIGQNMDEQENAEAVARLKATQIYKDDGSVEDLYSFLNGESKTIKHEYNGDLNDGVFNSFYITFTGGNPYELNSLTIPFAIKEKGTETDPVQLNSFSFRDGHFVFNMGELKAKTDYEIYVDFEDLAYQDFNFVLPEKNMIYDSEIEIDGSETFDFTTSATLTITYLDTEHANFDNINVSLRGSEKQIDLQKSEDVVENGAKFIIPAGTTPGFGANFYVDVKGIEIADALTLSTTSEDEVLNVNQTTIDRKIYSIYQEDEQRIVGVNDAGNQITFKETKNTLHWSYPTFEIGGQKYYRSAYQLNNYKVKFNDKEILDIAELLAGEEDPTVTKEIVVQEESAEEDAAEAEPTTKTYEFRAYRGENDVYDTFELDFYADEDTVISFTNFENQIKGALIGKNITDSRVQKVEYAIADDIANISESEWETIENENLPANDLFVGQLVAFKVYYSGSVSNNDFTVDSIAVLNDATSPSIKRGSDAQGSYIIYAYKVSSWHFNADTTIILTSSGAV